jgi:hypothetical protein
MKFVTIMIAFIGLGAQASAQHAGHSMPHEMQHGFVLAADDTFASHLVANGHHSRQTEIIGQLLIEDQNESALYQERKLKGDGSSYFLFQAQNLDLPTLSEGQVLNGHIIESKMGEYEPKNKIVSSATFQVQKILLNIPNPFFAEDEQHRSASSSQGEGSYTTKLLNSMKREIGTCCETGKKPCNWKCY